MARLVQKFGGSSVKDIKHIQNVAKIVASAKGAGKDLIVVVSAMGDTTDDLINLAAQLSSAPDPRELDVLLATGEQISISLLTLALMELGLKARSFTGPQAGIVTDDSHGFARIKTVQASRIESSLATGEIAVVAGFQGMSRRSELTTLGRGGSDTTAVALAAALKAECCDIYTDVDGIYTSDPRFVAAARRLRAISYEEMLVLSSLGANVLNARSVELAMKNQVPVRLRSTFQPEDTGTLVSNSELTPDYEFCGVALDSQRIAVTLSIAQDFSTSSKENEAAKDLSIKRFFEQLEQIGVFKDSIKISRSEGQNISLMEFTCESRHQALLRSIFENGSSIFSCGNLKIDSEIATISVVGPGVNEKQKVSKRLLSVLNQARIPVALLTSDRLSMSCVVPEKYKDKALKEVHSNFFEESFCTTNLNAGSRVN